MKPSSLILLFLLTIQGVTANANTNDSIAAEFDKNMKRVFIVDAIINDSIKSKVFFDSGTYGLIVADSLHVWDTTTNPKKLQIGEYYNAYLSYPAGLLDNGDTRNPVYKTLGIGAIVGWDFFDGKIVELSYENQYIKVLKSTNHLVESGYVRIPMKKRGNVWGVSSTITLQGKRMEVWLMVDTGNSSTATLNHNLIDKYEVDQASSSIGATADATGVGKRYIFPADTIRVLGAESLVDRNIAFRDTGRRSPFDGILGNTYFQEYSVVLDFRNGDIYLKKVASSALK